jgi:hypothetical protein
LSKPPARRARFAGSPARRGGESRPVPGGPLQGPPFRGGKFPIGGKEG